MKMHLYTLTLTSALLLGATNAAHAEGNFGLGLGAFNGSTVYKNIDTEVYILPVLMYEGENFSLSPTRAEYHLQFNSNMWVSAIGALRLQGYDAEDNATFKGMDDRDIGIDLGASVNYYSEEIGFLSVEWLTDVSDASEGDEVSAIWAYPIEGKALTITPSVFWRWQSEDLVDYYYGVTSKEATASRAAYKADSASTFGAALSLDYKLTKSITLFSEVSAYSLDDEIKNSPLVDDDKDYGYGASIGFVYSF
ncbi:MltA-interacting protein [Pseudoalteromonas holothuriae]|uniref:MltA-interacting protein n=1 Tax=Pseudoalteromonas holothuriae TaxID=2963714 RepID=A0A9W4VLJ3_9GAMM|nr:MULTISPECIES: MipA/OmpV family protein [unclassified Pseudoalteromonas]CAH9049676.1 MltA-interacting protein [Pseudoalteromonas sp. CIP111854]CAH9051609.1 MltA-interacting protein [Pseudoalteromonas sp. CIP111951]